MYTEPNVCLKCKEVVTFCECDESITNKDEYIEWLENSLSTVDVCAIPVARLSLLDKYMAHIIDCEGVDFISKIGSAGCDQVFTTGEINQLEKIQQRLNEA